MYKITTLFVLLSFFGFSQKEEKEKQGNVFSNTGDATKMFSAKQKLMAGDYVSALNSFREVEKNNPGNATVKYYVGLCYFNINDKPKAKESLLKALEINKEVKPETHFLIGRIYQGEENFDTAIQEYQIYKGIAAEDKEAKEDVETYLSQCNNAKTFMASPLPLEVVNLGITVNSKYDDKNPCITADGSILVFTTRRPETTNDPTDIEGDGKYFENIYLSYRDSNSKNFNKASGISSSINSKSHDACTSISPDGKQLFIYYNSMNVKAKRGGNIFFSKFNNGKWKTPESLSKPINSSYWEGGVCVSADGKRYFFSSERPGGFGNSDIWIVEKLGKTEWSEPVNLGSDVNSPFDEAGMFLAPDGKTLFFCSNGPKSMGGYDVFKTTFDNGKWSTPVNLGYPINTPSKEGQLSLSADGLTAYISSDRKGGFGENDLYKIDLSNYSLLNNQKGGGGNGLSILKGTIREGFEGYGIQEAEVSLKNEQNEIVASTLTNENGEYFFTLIGGKYTLEVKKKGFQTLSELIELNISSKETIVLEKGYLLKK